MSASFKHRMLVWAWNGFQFIIGGCSATLLAVSGVEAGNVFVPNLTPHFTMHQILSMLAASGVVSLAQYLRTPTGKLPSIDTEPGDTHVP